MNWTRKIEVFGIITTMTGFLLGELTDRTMPYSYHQTFLDTVDYIFGKNVLHRKNSLM